MARRRSNLSTVSLFSFQDIVTATTGIFVFITIILALALVNSVPQTESGEDLDGENVELEFTQLAEQQSNLELQLTKEVAKSQALAGANQGLLQRRLADLEDSVETLRYRAEQAEAVLRNKRKDLLEEEVLAEGKVQQIAKVGSHIDSVEKQIAALSKRLVYQAPKTTKTSWLVQLAAGQIEIANAQEPKESTQFRSVRAFREGTESLSPSNSFFVLVVKPSGIAEYQSLYSILKQDRFEIGVDVIAEHESYLEVN